MLKNNKVNQLHITMFYEKITFSKIKLGRIVALFYIFASLFDIRLKRIQVGSYICFCTQSVVIQCLDGSI